MKSRAIIPLAVGLLVGVVAIKYSLDLSKARGDTSDSDIMNVVVARKDIPATIELTAEMLVATKSPHTPLIPRNAFTDLKTLVGRVALKSIPQGVPILPSMIAPEGTEPGLIVRVKEGYRAVAVKIDESTGVGYLVKPGDWVDVLVVMDVKRTARARAETISRVILQRVQVGAVGQDLSDVNEESKNSYAKTVTLIVEEEDVPKLHLAQTRGRITLAMRGQADSEITRPAEASESEVFADHSLSTIANQPRLGGLVGGLLKAAMESKSSRPATPRTYVDRSREVLVVNGSTKDGNGSDAKRLTFQDEDSMQVVNVQGGNEPSQRSTPPVFEDYSYRNRALPTGNSSDWDKDSEKTSGPNEVTE